jgi:nucleoid DNA-binding protein
MKKNELIQMLNNKVTALEAKKCAAFEKGAFELYEIFDNQIADIKLTLEGFDNFNLKQVEEKVIENLPNLALYVRKKSIHEAIKSSIRFAYNSLKKESV